MLAAMPDLILVFLMGILGSAHCVGMCGGFVLALSQAKTDRGNSGRHQVLYFMGKTVTYAVLGALVGGSGAAISGLFQGVQVVLSVALGVLLIGVGLGLFGVWNRISKPRRGPRRWTLSSAMARMLRGRRPAGSLGLGMLNGLLPCGLVYAALAYAAASGSWVSGALVMAVFGLATIPALGLVAVAGHRMSPAFRVRMNRMSGVFVVLLGLLTIIRGTPLLHHLMPGM